jgi:hypothetical protein
MTSTDVIPVRSFAYKREAKEYLESAQRAHGGEWELDSYGRGQHFVTQTKTAEQAKRAQEAKTARITLDPEFDYFGSRFGGAYRAQARMEEQLDDFAKRFENDPLYALKWGTDTIQIAAEYKVLQAIIELHKAGHDNATICRYVESEAASRVSRDTLSRSTDPMSNLAEQAERIAFSKYAKQLRSFVDNQETARGILAAAGDNLSF